MSKAWCHRLQPCNPVTDVSFSHQGKTPTLLLAALHTCLCQRLFIVSIARLCSNGLCGLLGFVCVSVLFYCFSACYFGFACFVSCLKNVSIFVTVAVFVAFCCLCFLNFRTTSDDTMQKDCSWKLSGWLTHTLSVLLMWVVLSCNHALSLLVLYRVVGGRGLSQWRWAKAGYCLDRE